MYLHYPGFSLEIGRPISNNTIYVLDQDMQPVKVGEVGTMWAGGVGTTRGYLNMPDETAERYKRDPFLDDG